LTTLESFNVAQDKDGNKERLMTFGGTEELAKKLGVNIGTGLTKAQVEELHGHFGLNKFPESPMTTFLELFLGTFEDPVLLVLIGAGCVSLGISGGLHGEWLEGIAIFIAVLLVATIDSVQNYQKELKFRELEKSAANDERCMVLREGTMERINPADLAVGDVIVLGAGDSVPADSVVIDTSKLKTNEAALTGEADDLSKSQAGDIFLLSSTLVTEADETHAMVIGIGPFSQWGRIKANLVTDKPQTPLQEKLEEMTNQIGMLGLAAAVATFIAVLIRAFCAPEHEGKDMGERWEAVLDGFVVAVTIVVVAIPEGLPLAVTIALAYSTGKMYQDQNLIRTLAACETMGNATNICSDKTGTLTENRMTVVAGLFADRKVSQEEFSSINADTVTAPLRDFVCAQSCVNRTAILIYKGDNGEPLTKPKVIGNKTEGALMMMSKAWGADEEALKNSMFDATRDKIFSFNSSKKRSTCIVTLPDGKVRVFCKGATEWMMKDCTHFTDSSGSPVALDQAKRDDIDAYIKHMADQALRTLCLTHRDFASMAELPANWRETPPDGENLVMDCVVGIIDPLRSDVVEAVATAQRAGVTVRMVTGDNIHTAKAIARQCGILTDEGEAIEGPTFRNMTPAQADLLLPKLQVMGRSSPDDKFLMVTRLNGAGLPTNETEWLTKHPNAVPGSGITYDTHRDKLLPGYRSEWEESHPDGGEVVGVTGDGTNDAPALKAADVGLAMGEGTEVAKGASDIVILDDKFSSIVKAIMWGRNVYDNIRKFLQFQLTVNVVALVTVFIAAASGGPPPLNAVQMLWVNLIMDTLGALALATEMPTPELLERLPYKRSASLISRPMWRNILSQSAFQIVLLLVLMFAGAELFGTKEHLWCIHWEKSTDAPKNKEFKLASLDVTCDEFFDRCEVDDDCDEDHNGEYYDKEFEVSGKKYNWADIKDFEEECLNCKHHDHHLATIMFNAFIFCQFFNEFVARSIKDKWNCFEGIMTNPVFLGVSLFTLFIQIILITFCGAFIETKPYPGLEPWEWGITIALGAITLPVGVAMRFIPVAEDPEDFAKPMSLATKKVAMGIYADDTDVK
jgi:Ca2+-transporting ATPase